MSAYIPAFVSEFPDVTVADCVPAAALMVANKVTHNRYPASVAEREALQVAMGTQDRGAANEQAADGLHALLGLSLPVAADRSVLAALLADPAKGLAVIGDYQALPATIRQHGRQPSYAGLHDIYLGGLGGGQVVVGDPLGDSMGPVVPLAAVDAYLRSTSYAALVGSEQPTIVGYRLVSYGGPLTTWRVVRYTTLTYAPLTVSYRAGSWAPVAHGRPGFWLLTAGPSAGHYAIYGRSQAFRIEAVYSTGTRVPVPAGS